MERAGLAAVACDFSLVAGSSLVVYPAAGFPLMAKRAGAKLATLNRTPTDQDIYANWRSGTASDHASQALAEL
jgi:NAD-dependent deacetylase